MEAGKVTIRPDPPLGKRADKRDVLKPQNDWKAKPGGPKTRVCRFNRAFRHGVVRASGMLTEYGLIGEWTLP